MSESERGLAVPARATDTRTVIAALVPADLVVTDQAPHLLWPLGNACVAHLYDLDEEDLAVVYETFHEGADYSERYRSVLTHFRRWAQR